MTLISWRTNSIVQKPTGRFFIKIIVLRKQVNPGKVQFKGNSVVGTRARDRIWAGHWENRSIRLRTKATQGLNTQTGTDNYTQLRDKT